MLWIIDHLFTIAVVWSLAVLFPLPWLNQRIITFWRGRWDWLKLKL